ncbi:MAG: heterodisulfide reductase-related iron-sulfur binding cluster [Candidatus Kapaibacterium sp.]
MDFGIKNIIFTLIFLGAFGFFTKNVLKLISYLKLAKPDDRFGDIVARLKQTLIIAIGQTKILRDKKAGPIHAGIFWGFLILLFSAKNSIIAGLFGWYDFFAFLGPIYSIISILTDIFCVAIIIAVAAALWRRYIVKVNRLQVEAEKFEAAFILLMIFTIVTSLLLENSTASVMYESTWAVRPISAGIGAMLPTASVEIIHEVAFWIHILLIFAFMNYLPYSKHLHVLTSVPNVYFSNLGPVNKLKNIDFEDESIEKYGVSDVEDFGWKTLMDGYTCTHCGRCSSVCPAATTGKILDPRQIIIEVRDRTMDKMPILSKLQKGEEISEQEQAILDKKFVGDYQSIEALWQCTTCGACMQECPVNIEHVPAIIDMRRSLVMMESEFPPLLQNTFGNLETNATPWAFPPSERADWAENTGIKTAAELQEFDILFWVGCAGSFDDRAKKVSLAFSKLMQSAGINFAILGTEEQCNGDVARRTGNEYLADMLVKANIETMSQYKFKKIVATCPHCFNTLKNEYPSFGANYEVIHHSQYIMELIKEGKLSLSEHSDEINDFTYHDSCYIGRYNNIYDEPRNTLLSVPGLNLKEPARSKDKGFCCGAGGGQMFLEEDKGKRVNIERTEELLDTGAKTIAVNCPFCMTMISDGVKAKEAEGIHVKDISELVFENLKKD